MDTDLADLGTQYLIFAISCMARLARGVLPGYPHHFTQRGNRRQDVFFEEGDYDYYLELLAEWCGHEKIEIRAYCLMTNHVHLMVKPGKKSNLGKAIGEVHRRYTLMVNFREHWKGYLWQGRFASYPMDKGWLLRAAAYVELNPVKAGMVKNAWEVLFPQNPPQFPVAEGIIQKGSELSETREPFQIMTK